MPATSPKSRDSSPPVPPEPTPGSNASAPSRQHYPLLCLHFCAQAPQHLANATSSSPNPRFPFRFGRPLQLPWSRCRCQISNLAGCFISPYAWANSPNSFSFSPNVGRLLCTNIIAAQSRALRISSASATNLCAFNNYFSFTPTTGLSSASFLDAFSGYCRICSCCSLPSNRA